MNGTHPEAHDSEVCIGNIYPGDFKLIGWKSKRLGKIARDANDDLLSGGGMKPVFVCRQEIEDTGIKIVGTEVINHRWKSLEIRNAKKSMTDLEYLMTLMSGRFGNHDLRVLVTGGRDFTDIGALFAALDEIHLEQQVSTIIHGGAKGADTFAGYWAWERGIGCEVYTVEPIDGPWPAAGMCRNARMLAASNPDVVIGFPTLKSKGTWGMLRLAQSKGVPTRQPLQASLGDYVRY